MLNPDETQREVEANTEMARTHASVAEMLREAGLRPTRQRMALGYLLFGQQDRHVTAEMLHAEAVSAGEKVRSPPSTIRFTSSSMPGFYASWPLKVPRPISTPILLTTIISMWSAKASSWTFPATLDQGRRAAGPPAGTKISHIDVVVRLTKG